MLYLKIISLPFDTRSSTFVRFSTLIELPIIGNVKSAISGIPPPNIGRGAGKLSGFDGPII